MAGPPTFGLPRISYPVPTSAVVFSASPRLLGRYSAGAGEGQEIGLGVFSIAGGTLAVPAAAQYDLLGRRTAGAGDMEISTRLQMNIPNLEAGGNVFIGSQTFNPVTAVSVTLTGTTLTATRAADSAGAYTIRQRKSRGSDAAAPVIVNSGDFTGTNVFSGYDGASFIDVALIQGSVIEPVPGVGAMGGRLTFQTTTLATATLATVLVLEAAAIKAFGTATANIVIDNNRGMHRRPLTFATLPAAAANADTFYTITDGAAAPVWGAAAAGGAAVRTPVWSNGAAWLNG